MECGEGGGEKQADTGGEKRDIRRPMNAFLIFCKRHRSMVREKHPDRDNRSVTRILGDLWANLADDEKAVYTNLAKTYKDAFMKANPDYKWHSTDRLPQPGKMATRPTNVRPPRSLSVSDTPPFGISDGDKLGGVNLLLLAGKQSMPIDQQLSSSLSVSLAGNKLVNTPDLMAANSALLQLAEMCSSSELATRAVDPAMLRSAPPKKRARHWSHSDALLHNADTKLSTTTSLFFQAIPTHTATKPAQPHPTIHSHLIKPVPAPTATQTSQEANMGERQELLYPAVMPGVAVQRKEGDHCSAFTPVEVYSQVVNSTATVQLKEEKGNVSKPDTISSTIMRSEPFPADMSMPPKKKFTKLHDRYRGDKQTVTSAAVDSRPAVATSTTSSEGGCLSDQNDNAIFTCGKVVVNHIIERLFCANLMSSEEHQAPIPSSTDIEKVRRIITAEMTGREQRLQGAPSKDVGRLLSEVVHKPQNLVEKVIEEAYSLDLTHRAAQLPPGISDPCPRPTDESEPLIPIVTVPEKGQGIMLEPVAEPTGPSHEGKHMSTVVTPAPLSSVHTLKTEPLTTKTTPLPHAPVKEEREEREVEEMVTDTMKEDMDYLQEEEEGYSQPVRKSRRRNRGQRYQELINEGIIQPSKERLAARRHEQTPVVVTAAPVSSRDFDLEAEIATLPPCSLDQVPRRRGPRKRSDSENGQPPLSSPSQLHVKEESSSPEPVLRSVSPAAAAFSTTAAAALSSATAAAATAEPLTGSQKRKARKHSINRLVASSTDSGSKAKPPGIEASIPMVRDATVSPVRKVFHSDSPVQSGTRSVAPSEAGPVSSSVENVTSACVWSLGADKGVVHSVDRIWKCENSSAAEKECFVEEWKMVAAEQTSSGAVDCAQSVTAVHLPDAQARADTDKPNSPKSTAAKPKSVESVCDLPSSDLSEVIENQKDNDSNEKTASFRDCGWKESAVNCATAVQSVELENTGIVWKTGTDVASTDVQNGAKPVSVFSTEEYEEGSWQVLHALSAKVIPCAQSENSVRNGEGNQHDSTLQLKKASSADRGQSSSMEDSDDTVDRKVAQEELAESRESRPSFFLSQPPSLLCLSEMAAADSQSLGSTDKSQCQHCLSNNGCTAILQSMKEELSVETADQDSLSPRVTAAMDAEDSLDSGSDMVPTIESLSQFSPFSSATTTTTTGPRVTTVTMTTSDALPTALSLEMMEEEGMVDSGMANPLLCGSPMPESPSVTAVHS